MARAGAEREAIVTEADEAAELRERLEALRQRMTSCYAERGSLLDPKLLALSQELDRLLMRLLRSHGVTALR